MKGLLWGIVLAVLIISLVGAWWTANQDHRRITEGTASLRRTEGQSSEAGTPIVETSPEGKVVGAETHPIANLPR
jgi:hypothetical protein